MTKRLLNLNKSTRIITILLTTLLFLPSIARAEETITYDLTIGGIEVTSDNATDVLGDGKVSFDPETNTLTLNNAILSDDIICNITSLFIDIIGSNSITTNGKPAISTTLEAASPKISIKSTSNPIGSLVLRNTSQETPCGGVVKGNISINAEAPISILLPTSSNFLTMDTTHVAAFGKSYDLMVGSEAVTNINASDILGDGKATYDPDKNTLSLNGVTTSMIYCKAPQPLTIEINGSNTVGMIVGYGGDENPLTIKKSGSSPASLDINPGDQVLDDMGPVFHFSSCTWGDGLYLVAYSNNTTISGAYYDESGRQFKHSTNSSINRVIISTPSIWIGGRGPNEYGKFTFDGDSIAGAWFDASRNTLTLNAPSFYLKGGDIVSSLPNLTIKLVGGQTEMGSFKITSSIPEATLKFTTDANNPGSISNSLGNNSLPWEGFAGSPTFENKLVYLPNHDSQSIKILEAPSINYSNGNLEFGGLSDGYGNNYFDCHYTITYGDGTTETGQNNEQVSLLSVPKQQLTPCTVTAYAEFKDQFNNTTRSDNAIAYYLEFAEDMKVTFDGTEREILKSDYPALIPDVEDIEFILSNSTNQNAICQETINNESHIKIKGFGATDLILYNSNPGFTVLNSGGGAVALSATVVPSAPTFSVESGTYNEAQTLTLASPYQKTNGDDQTVINIKYYTDGNSNNPVTYTGPISINQSTTITVWVEASVTLPTGAQETYSSDEISQEYVIKEEAFIDFMQEENGEYSPIGANQVITGTYGHTIPKVVMPYVSDLQGTITFSSSDETVVASSSISLDEEYTLKYTVSGAGNTTIQAKYTPGADEPFLSTTRNFNLKIEPRDISNATISMGTNGESSFVYNGAAIEPITSVSLAASGTAIAATLNAKTDFDSNYYLVSGETETALDGAPTNVGSYKVTVSAKGNYTGSKSATFTIIQTTITPTVEITGWTYGATANTPSVSGNTGEGSVTYEYKLQNAEDSKYSTEVPTEAGNYTIKATIAATVNYEAAVDSTHFTISKANITPTVALEGWAYGATANTPSVSGNTGEGSVTYEYKLKTAEDSEYKADVPTEAGDYTIKATIAATANFEGATTTTDFTITKTSITPTVTLEGWTYGTTAKTPTISGNTGNGSVTYEYKLKTAEDSEYKADAPTEAGEYTIKATIAATANYEAATATTDFTISKANITPTVTLEGWTYGATANTPTITGNSGDGTVTYTYKAEGAESFVETAPEAAGNYTIKASIAETTNYNAGEATATFTITAATMTVTAKGYEGTYDGKAHGITVSAPEDATIKYGTAEGSYELNASPEYTAGGNYTVYYQVTMDNYATVTGSETVKISKAEAELEFDVPEESKVYATIGKEFTEPTLNNLKGLDVTFSSSDESVATVDKNTGKVTLKSAGLTYITATFAGNDNYNEFAVKYELRVKGSYNLWIDNVQVTSDNYNDILENQKFFYDLVNKWLIITNNETPVTVKSSMPELTIYLNGKSELERIYFDNQGNAQNTGTLSFFNYNDVPGKLTLDTNNDNGVISGFSSISFDDNTKLRFIDPDSCEYKDGLVKMTKPSQLGEIVKQVTIGQYIEPMANGDGISFGNIDSETNITNMTIEDKLLITATQHEEGSNEDDDYIDPNNGAFVMNTTNTSEDVEVLSQGVESGNKQPGSEDYADSFRGGITFMIPSGTGTIELELMNEEGYMLMLKIGTGVPHEIVRYERATVVIDYNVDEPTYVYLYLEEKSIIGARRAGNNTRVGKRDKAHGTVFSVKVKAASVSSTNPLNNVEGATGNITIPDVNTTTPSGDDVPTKAEFKITNDENKANDDKWYTIDGQRINKPTQKGVYIRNRKKVVVK